MSEEMRLKISTVIAESLIPLVESVLEEDCLKLYSDIQRLTDEIMDIAQEENKTSDT